MTQTVNQTVLSGTIRKLFDHKVTSTGLSNLAFSVKFPERDKEKQILVNVFGDQADELNGNVAEGDYVIVQGRITENAWQDKETQEWNHRHEIIASRVVNLGELDEEGAFDD